MKNRYHKSFHFFQIIKIISIIIFASSCTTRESGNKNKDGIIINNNKDISQSEIFDQKNGQDIHPDVLPNMTDTQNDIEIIDGSNNEQNEIDLHDEFDSNETVEPKDVQKEQIEEIIPAQQVEISNALCSTNPKNYNIFDLQNPNCPNHPSPEPTKLEQSIDVKLTGKIITAVFKTSGLSGSFYIQEPQGGPYSGILVYAHGKNINNLKRGQIVNVQGKYFEFFGMSEIWLTKWEVTAEGFIVQPYIIEHPSYIATKGSLSEYFEGVLVRVNNVVVTDTKPDCPTDVGDFMVNGDLRINNFANFSYSKGLGDKLLYVIGLLYYNNSDFKLEPRDDKDINVFEKGDGSLTKCINAECIEPLDAIETGELIITEVMYDPSGSDDYWEYFEVYNPGTEPIDIKGWSIRDCKLQNISIKETATNTIIKPQQYYVLARSDQVTNFNQVYSSDFYLANTNGSILLYNKNDQLVDQIRYAGYDPWPHKVGHSLILKDISLDNIVMANWELAEDKIGSSKNFGTPGY